MPKKYVKSDNIAVYPSARRGVKNSSSRLVTEQALVSIVNKLIDTDGFVITKPADLSDSKPFEFNIYGYYFRIEPASTITSLFEEPSEGDTIYGSISLSTLNRDPAAYEALNAIYELEGQDEDGDYTGVEFSLEPPIGEDVHYLSLFTYSNGGWIISKESLFKFSVSSTTGVIDVDGGEI